MKRLIVLLLVLVSSACLGAVDDGYTVSLLHFDGNIVDEATRTWTAYGTATTTTATGKWGGALVLPAAGAYIDTPWTADTYLTNGSFTIDFWYKTTQASQDACILSHESAGNGYAFYINYYTPNSGDISFDSVGITPIPLVSTIGGFNDGNWHHVAISRDGSTFRLFVDGSLRASKVDAASISDSATSNLRLGKSFYVSNPDYVGLIDEFRFTRGYARWVATFTPPTSPYGTPPATPTVDLPGLIAFGPGGRINFSLGDISRGVDDAYTKSLLHFDGDWTDQSGKTWSLQLSPWINTSSPKFGAGAMSNATQGYFIYSPDSDDWYMDGDFTWDWWFRPADAGPQFAGISVVNSFYQTGGGAYFQQAYVLRDPSGVYLRWYCSNGPGNEMYFDSVMSISAGVWTHLAIDREGNTWRAYQDGSVIGGTTNAIALGNYANAMTFGYNQFSGSPGTWEVSMDEPRLTKGLARYKGIPFTPPFRAYGTGGLAYIKFGAVTP